MSTSKWKWCGHAHHFIAADSCRFHLATWVAGGRFLVSSVGDYRPHGSDKPEPIGAGKDSLFETFVFKADPDALVEGCPTVTDWSEEDSIRYATAEEANRGHLKLCRKYDRLAASVPQEEPQP